LVGGFVAEAIGTLDESELDALEAVLELPDLDLFDWLTGRRPVPPEVHSPLLERMVAWSLAQRGVTAPGNGHG